MFLKLDFICVFLQAQNPTFPDSAGNADTANLGISYLTLLILQRGQSVLPSPLLAKHHSPPPFISLMSSSTAAHAHPMSADSHTYQPCSPYPKSHSFKM